MVTPAAAGGVLCLLGWLLHLVLVTLPASAITSSDVQC
jgi:hypothetical protein